MSGGLNAKFRANPQTFLNGVAGIVSALQPSYQGAPTGLNQQNIGEFNLIESPHKNGSVDLELYSKRSHGMNSSSIRAYYLISSANQSPTIQLGTAANFFFTDTITGCQFSAYGNDRNNLTVCHANALDTGGEAALSIAATTLTSQGHTNCGVFGPQTYRLGSNDPMNVKATVIGWRKGDGWHFYYKRSQSSSTSGGKGEKTLTILDQNCREITL